MTLSDFLLARIAEDEAAQRVTDDWSTWIPGEWHRADCERNTYDIGPCNCGAPARVLAECDARRRIVEIHATDDAGRCEQCAGVAWDVNPHEPDVYPVMTPCPTLQALALPYVAHPDFDPTWLPASDARATDENPKLA